MRRAKSKERRGNALGAVVMTQYEQGPISEDHVGKESKFVAAVKRYQKEKLDRPWWLTGIPDEYFSLIDSLPEFYAAIEFISNMGATNLVEDSGLDSFELLSAVCINANSHEFKRLANERGINNDYGFIAYSIYMSL